MRKCLLLFISFLAWGYSYSQLTGIKSIPGDYLTIQAAIAALNTSGVGAGGVTFNVAAGHIETFTSGTAGLITATGTAANPVVFQKSGVGNNPRITSGSGNSSNDGIIKFAGCDYITFNGINIIDNPTNNTNNKRMEYGFALVKKNSSAPFDGCQYITIINCSVSLVQSYASTRGIYSGNHTASAITSLNLTSMADVHANCSFSNDSVMNCNQPISLNGYNAPSPYTLYDQNMQVGTNGGNVITNFAGGKGIYTKNLNNLEIANNIITEATGSNTAIYGIYADYSNASTAKIHNNTISLKNGTSLATTIYGIVCGSGSTGSGTSTVRIYDNTVQNCSFGTTNAQYFYGIDLQSSPDTVYITGNQILNNTMPGMNYFYGINASASTTPVLILTNNTVSGNQKTGESGEMYCIRGGQSVIRADSNHIFNNSIATSSGLNNCYLAGYYSEMSLSTEIISSNYIYNLTIGGTNSNTTNRVDGIYTSSASVKLITGNQVYGLTTHNGFATGVRIAYCDILYLNNNDIHAIASQAGVSNSTAVRGIDMSMGNTFYLYNNFISDLYTVSAAYGNSIAGIYQGNNVNIGQVLNMFYNTVYLDASSTGTDFGSSAFYSDYSAFFSSYLNIQMQNNIFIDKSTPNGTGLAVAFRKSGMTFASFWTQSNNNNYFAGTPGPQHLIFSDGAYAFQQITDYKNLFSPADNASFSDNTFFINTASKPYNLHIDPSVATQCESGGMDISVPIAVNSDYDYESRYPYPEYPDSINFPATAPDVGADEFAGQHLDLVPPSITYTPLGNTGYTGNRTLNAIITDDFSGIPTSGIGLPVLYWRTRNGITQPWQAATGEFFSTDEYQFTFGGTALDGDSVEYFIVAQDLAPVPNVAVTPLSGSTGLSADPPACDTVPYPDGYVIASICGTFYVGSGQHYETLQDAFTDLYQREVICPVTFLLTDSVYASTHHTLYPATGASSTNTITIKPAPGVTAWLTTFSSMGLFLFEGGSYFIIDGSNLPDGNTSNLILQNIDGTDAPVIAFSSNGNTIPAGVTIKNCNLIGGGSTYRSYGIESYYSPVHDLTIQNNRIWNVVTGILLNGSVSDPIDGCQIINNTIGSEIDTLLVSKTGIEMSYTNDVLIKNNLITNIKIDWDTPRGIWLREGNVLTKIIQNNISGIRYTGNYGYGGKGIDLNTGNPSSAICIANNLVSDISGDGSSELEYDATAGIRVTGNTGGVELYHNSVNLFGSVAGIYSSLKSSAFYSGPYTASLSLMNNIFRNTIEDTAITDTKAYAFYSDAGQDAFTIMNNNCYFASGSQGVLASFGGSDITDIAGLAAATGQDSASIANDPLFNNAYTLVPSASSPVISAGYPVPLVTTDYLGIQRSLTNPSIGAYENGVGVSKNLSVYALLQGLYEGSGLMRKAQNGNGSQYTGVTADKIRIELHAADNYQTIVYALDNINLTNAGAATIQIPLTYSGQYYVTIKHRNSIETTSALPISFEFDNITCLFNSPDKVYGNNLVEAPDGNYLMFGGDVNQDGVVDQWDLDHVLLKSDGYVKDYIAEDINGDGTMDALDLIISDNNAAAFVSVKKP